MLALMTIVCRFACAAVAGFVASASVRAAGDVPAQVSPAWDNFSDTWAATDGLGRHLPDQAEAGPPRPDRTVGLFYFLWHGAHIQGGPYDVTRILARDPDAMEKPDSPLWGPLHAPHHWGESIFGYYLVQDEGVLRKHAQMLGDAGVDVVIFDVTNQITYRDDYRALLRVWTEVRRAGNRTPAVAFLCPFWDPAKVVRELWRDLYEPGLAADLWFRWDHRPLILADPAKLGRFETVKDHDGPARLEPGHTLGQSFTVEQPFESAGGAFPTWANRDSAITLSLYRDNPKGARVLTQRFERVQDNAWLALRSPTPLAPGTYYLEMSEPRGTVGWWSHTQDRFARGQAYADGGAVAGDRNLQIGLLDDETARIRQFFTFRKPQPDYFQGPTGPDMWSWLEVYPQHVFTNSLGHKEQMSVGVAQNAVGDRLGSMSEPGARGRSWHGGARDTRPNAVWWGLNVEEQWERARREDPRFLFITGWNEWIAGRFSEFNGIKRPVMFVDQFDQEHSRDIEPMRGGHTDHYYYQMIGQIRRYKGVRPLPALRPGRVRIDGRFADWQRVEPEFRDTVGDPMRRQHRGWDTNVTYADFTGRNDLVGAKVSVSRRQLEFYVRTAAPLTPPGTSNWMVLYLDLDADPRTGWLGYDAVVNRQPPAEGTAVVERHAGSGYAWVKPVRVPCRGAGAELELGIPFNALGVDRRPPVIEFKWADNVPLTGDPSAFTLHGDAAPNDRFNYRIALP